MSLPSPEPGLVIGYSYLWASEAASGRQEGSKDRPCAVLLTCKDEDGRTHVRVLPITHSRPTDLRDAFEIPSAIKRFLGLDAEQSWIVISELNVFIWPGPDLRPVPNSGQRTVSVGLLPPRFFDALRRRYVERARESRAKAVKRTE